MSKTAEQKLYSDKKLDTSVYKCPNCGGEAVFDATKQKMRCMYCDSLFDIETNEKVVEKDINELLSNAKVWKEAEVYQCKSCGAKEIISAQEVAHECAFCGTNNIVKIEEMAGLKPQGVVPFKVDDKHAEQVAQKWARSKFYAPRSFKKSAKAENIKGVYNPVFTFDCDTRSTYEGRLGKNYTTYSHVNGKTVAHTHTNYFNVKGSHAMKFDDYLIQASSNITTDTLVKISPFSTNDAPKYTQDYLRGYAASTYNKDGQHCWKECQSWMKYDIEKQILKKYDYDVKDYLNINTTYINQTYKYLLVPVYVGHTTFKGKLYNFYVNGENGKITGKTPVSGWKVAFTVIGILAIIALIVAGIYILD